MSPSRRRRASSASIWCPTAPTSPTNARSVRRALPICRQWISSARGICSPTSPRSSARSTSCSARSTGDCAAADPVRSHLRRAGGREPLGAVGRARAGGRLKDFVALLASRLHRLRQPAAQDASRAQHCDQAEFRRGIRVSLRRRLLEQAAQSFLPLRGRAELLFHDSADVDYTLLDCGANYGYWSVLVSSAPYGSHKAIAIEPSSENFAKLANNAQINGNRLE